MGLVDDLAAGSVALDASIFIYFIERQEPFRELIRPLFEQADNGERELVSAMLTVLEVLVVPYRIGDAKLVAEYEALLTGSRGVRLVEIDRGLLRMAANLRASTGVKTPDAIQLAAAIAADCPTFLTNDRRLPNVPGLRILQLSDYIPRRRA